MLINAPFIIEKGVKFAFKPFVLVPVDLYYHQFILLMIVGAGGLAILRLSDLLILSFSFFFFSFTWAQGWKNKIKKNKVKVKLTVQAW